MPTWNTATDWDNAQSESGVVHESVANTDHNDATVVKQGYTTKSVPYSSNNLAYWPLHEDSGTTAYDFGGLNLGFDGDIKNNPNLGVGGLLGTTSYEFALNTDQHIIIDSNIITNIENSNAFTFSAWVKITNKEGDRAILSGGGGTGNALSLRYDNGEDSWFTVLNDENSDLLYAKYSQSTVNANEWHHLAGTYDGSTLKVYKDGVEGNTTASGSGTGIDNTRDFSIASTEGITRFWVGKIWDARVYDRALTQSEIQTLYDIVATSGTLTTNKKSL